MSKLQFKQLPSVGVFSGFYLHYFRKITNILTKSTDSQKQFREKKHWEISTTGVPCPSRDTDELYSGLSIQGHLHSFKHQREGLTLEQRADLQTTLHSTAFQGREQGGFTAHYRSVRIL